MWRTREKEGEREGGVETDRGKEGKGRAASGECSNEPCGDREDEEGGRKGGVLTRRQRGEVRTAQTAIVSESLHSLNISSRPEHSSD